jgi:hypothetical protein
MIIFQQEATTGIKPSATRDNSTGKLQFTIFLKLGSHYNLPIPLRFAFGIGVSTTKANFHRTL